MQGIRPQQDTYLHKGLRKKLVDELREQGIEDELVLKAIQEVPRHFFLDAAFERRAYENSALSIGVGQTISNPYTVAFQSQLLEVQPFDKILEIGTGSGYQCSILAQLGARVYTIERQKQLYNNLEQLHFIKTFPSIKRFYGDGFEGLPSFAPFDKIIITAAAPIVPEKLLQQLKIGGIMVIPLGEDEQLMKRIVKITATEFTEDTLGKFNFVPMLKGKVK